MFKVIAFAVVASVLHLAAATAAPNTTPLDDGPGRVSCRCKCIAGGISTLKVWDWSGSRSDCQGYNGAACRQIRKTKGKGTVEADGTLSGCDVIVIKTKPKDTVNKKPGGVLAPR
jgi:hypothetical protein